MNTLAMLWLIAINQWIMIIILFRMLNHMKEDS